MSFPIENVKERIDTLFIAYSNITDFEAIINPTFLPENKLERIIVKPTDSRGDPLLEQLLA